MKKVGVMDISKGPFPEIKDPFLKDVNSLMFMLARRSFYEAIQLGHKLTVEGNYHIGNLPDKLKHGNKQIFIEYYEKVRKIYLTKEDGMTRKDFEIIAEVVSSIEDDKQREGLAYLFAEKLRDNNVSFNKEKFYKNCNVQMMEDNG